MGHEAALKVEATYLEHRKEGPQCSFLIIDVLMTVYLWTHFTKQEMSLSQNCCLLLTIYRYCIIIDQTTDGSFFWGLSVCNILSLYPRLDPDLELEAGFLPS